MYRIFTRSLFLIAAFALTAGVTGGGAGGTASAAVIGPENQPPAFDIDQFLPDPRRYRPEALRQIIQYLRYDRKAGKLALAKYLSRYPRDWQALDIAGTSLMQDRNWDAAAAAFERSLKARPGTIDVTAKLGIIKIFRGHRDEGVRTLKAVVKSAPGHRLALRYLSWNALDTGRVALAIKYSERLIAETETGPVTRIHLDLAKLYNQAGRPGDTLKLLKPFLANAGNKKIPLETFGLILDAALAAREPDTGRKALRHLSDGLGTREFLRLALSDIRILQLEKRYRIAEQRLKSWRIEYPGHKARLNMELARLYRAIKRPGDAENLLKKISKDGDSGIRLAALRELAKIHFDAGRQEKAADALREALDYAGQQEKPALLRDIVAVMVGQGKQGDALFLLEKQAVEYPDLPQIPYLRAELQANAGERKASLETLAAISGKSPKFAPAHYLTGMILWQTKKPGQAARSFRQAVKLFPKHVKAWEGLAGVTHITGGNSAMLAILRDAVAANPAHTGLLARFAGIAYSEGLLAEAERSYRTVLDIDDTIGHAQIGLALILTDRNDGRSEADRLARKAIAARPKDAYAIDALGWTLVRGKSARQGIETLERAAKLNAKDGGIQYHLGVAYAAIGDAARGKAAMRRALSLGVPRHYRARIIEVLKVRR